MKILSRMLKVDDIKFPPLSIDNITDPVALTRALCKTSGAVRESGYKYPRASSIDGSCAREWVFGITSNLKRTEFIHFPLLMVFGIGSAIHKYYQNSTALFPNIVGCWRCKLCGHESDFGPRPAENCPKCGAPNTLIRYKEHYFTFSDPFYATGKIDLFLPVGNPARYRIGDIKGVADDKTEPRGGDIMQLASYLMCSKYDDTMPPEVDHTTGYLFYISKKMSFKAPVRTIKVTLTQEIEDTLMTFYMQVKRGVDEDMIPPKLVNCKNKECPFKVQCNEHGDRNDFI